MPRYRRNTPGAFLCLECGGAGGDCKHCKGKGELQCVRCGEHAAVLLKAHGIVCESCAMELVEVPPPAEKVTGRMQWPDAPDSAYRGDGSNVNDEEW